MTSYDWINLVLGIFIVTIVVAFCLYQIHYLSLGAENYEQSFNQATTDTERVDVLLRYHQELDLRGNQGITFGRLVNLVDGGDWDWRKDKPLKGGERIG